MKRFFIIIGISIVSQVAVAQCKPTITLSINGCTGDLGGRIEERTAESLFNHYMEQAGVGFSNKQECDAFVNIVRSELNNLGSGNCRIRVNVSPCTGCLGSLSNEANIIAIGQGRSFFSTNSANEIQNWSNDDMERMLALNMNFQSFNPTNVATGDPSFDDVRLKSDYSFQTKDYAPYIGNGLFKGIPNTPLEEINSTISSPDLDMFEPVWQMEKKSRSLPDYDVFAYKNRMHNEAAMQLEDILKRSNLTKEQLEGKVWEWDYLLNNFKLQENKNYSEEKEILEKAQLLAKYKVDYKAILNLKYIDSADENKHETEAAFLFVNGKTREQYYQEELEKKEKNLIENGISPNDIEIVKSQTEKEALIKDHVSTAVDIADGVGHVNEMVFAEGDKRHDVIKDILSGVSEGATLGVMVNNYITIESYNIIADAISKGIQGLEDRHKKSEDYYKEQRDKIQSISDIVKASSEDERKRTANMNRNESLKWSMGIDNSINKIKVRSRQDYYGAFPDIRKNEIIGREHVTIFRSNL